MKAFALAVIAAFLVAGVGFLALTLFQQDASTAFTTESVRVGEAAHKVAGPNDETASHSAGKSP